MGRDKHGKFVELATKRVNKALDQLRLVGNLANRTTYEYSDDEAKKIVRALQKEIDTVKSKFGDANGAGESKFSL
jgi:ABC-type Fe3+-hydroxamate transport system substrate-binding protein